MNKILKILILVVYTFAIFAVAFLIVSLTNKGPAFSEYTDKSSDENIALVTQIIEKRKNSEQNGTDYEKSTYDLYFSLKKTSTTIDLKNIYIYVAVETDEGIRYVQSSTAKDLTSTSTILSTISITNSSSGSFAVNEVTKEDDVVKHINKIPETLYVRVSYDKVVDKENIPFELNCKINYDDINKESFEGYEQRGIVTTSSNSTDYISYKEDVVQIKFLKIFNEEENSVDYSDYRISNVKIVKNNLPENVSMKKIKLEVFAEITNEELLTKKYFSKYVKLFVYEGTMIADINNSRTASLAEDYKVEKIYFNLEVELDNGEVRNSKFYVLTSDLLDK